MRTPGKMTSPDMDIVLAIHQVRQEMDDSIDITCRHIYGHQDCTHRNTCQEDTTHEDDGTLTDSWPGDPDESENQSQHICPATTHSKQPPKGLSIPAIVNIECDKIATETAEAVSK